MEVLYNLFVGPLELIFEIIFALANKLLNNPGLSIIFLSLTMNFLVLPLYKRADAMQAEQRDTEQRLKPWVDHIKKTFKGDERFMMLQTFYRQNNYKPTDALKGSVSLLLEIPFFIAAYQMLSHLQLLNGVEFGPIKDLGAPDQMFMIGTFAINVLPILMTVINLISGVIYTKGMSTQSKVQLFGMAAIFLVLLYNSPAGLVFYWTLNNVFSLVKNVFYKLKNPKLVLGIGSSIISLLCIILSIIRPFDSHRKQFFIIVLLLCMQLPLLLYIYQNKIRKGFEAKTISISKGEKITFFLGGTYLAVLTGLLIPSGVIKASPEEFINVTQLNNPLTYLLYSFALGIGMFVVWLGIFYFLASDKSKKIMGAVVWAICGLATVNYMFFGKEYGNISARLSFDNLPIASDKERLINIVVLLVVMIIMLLIWRFKGSFIKLAYVTLCIAIIAMSASNIVLAQPRIVAQIENIKVSEPHKMELPFSRNGKNVVVIMMDRAIGCQLPYIMNEKPELKQRLAGFTHYPNTISHGRHTNFGAPGLYGGYEYTPEQMNKRNNELLKDKQNEALKVMPKLFLDEGYEVTVSDPTYANYNWVPDLSIYDEYPEINRFNTMGNVDVESITGEVSEGENALNRNFFCYSMFKITPCAAQPFVYMQGSYCEPDLMFASLDELPKLAASTAQIRESTTQAKGYSYAFMRAYYAMHNWSNITTFNDSDKPSFIMMSNDTSHEPEILQAPNYEPQGRVDNTEYFEEHKGDYIINGNELKMETDMQVSHYHANMATIMQLANWCDLLRENGVYDNTKIIVVADHGSYFEQIEDLPLKDGEPLMSYNPLLLVKDFNASEFSYDMSFMTNADVPTLAMKDVIDNPVNPFTNKPINSDAKNGEQHIIKSQEWDISENNGTEFMESEWFSVKDNIYDFNNWKDYKPEG